MSVPSRSAVADCPLRTRWFMGVGPVLLLLCAAMTVAHANEDESPEYRLGSGDRVRVTVFGHEDLSGEFEIDGAGTISLPLISVLEARGLTTSELATTITEKLHPDYLKSPRVSVDVVGYRPFFIVGEVRNPGSYPFVNEMTVMVAVAVAGGYTYRASRKKITVIRADDSNREKRRVTEDTAVYPGDVIEVPQRYF